MPLAEGKKARLGACLGALAFVFAAASPGSARDEPGIYVEVSNLHNNQGSVRCGLFADEENWLGESPLRGARASIHDRRATCVFHDVKRGELALTVLHDEDDDGEMDKSALGLPQEGYGASRGAVRKGIGAPDWDDAKFTYRGGVRRLEIPVTYP